MQHVTATSNTEICCATSCLLGVVIQATKLCNLQSNNVARQVARKCCPYYLTLNDRRLLPYEISLDIHFQFHVCKTDKISCDGQVLPGQNWGSTPRKNWVGMPSLRPKTLALFMTKTRSPLQNLRSLLLCL